MNNSKSTRITNYLLGSLFLIFGLFLIFFGFILLNSVNNFNDLNNETSATVVDNRKDFKDKNTVAYYTPIITFTDENNTSHSKILEMPKLSENLYPVGSKIEIYYEKGNAAKVIVSKESREKHMIVTAMLLIFGLVFIFFGIFLVIKTLKSKNLLNK